MPETLTGMRREELLKFISLYQLNPYSFSQEEVDLIYSTAKDRGIPFDRDSMHVESSLADVVGQAASGFVSGFSTIHMGKDPETTYEAIARNVGHLFGFMGGVPGVGTVGSLLAKGTMMGARGLKAAKIISDVSKAEKAAKFVAPFTSVPMGAAKSIVKRVGNVGKVKAIGETNKYLRPGTKLRDVVTQAAELGIGSSIASWQGGVDEMFDGLIAGGSTGAIFGVLGNFQLQGLKDLGMARSMLNSANPATVERANKVIRTALMSSYTGLPSTLADEPIEMQVYQYGLGAYFGVRSVPAVIRSAGEFIREMPAKDRLNPERVEGFDALIDPVKKEVLRQATFIWGRQIQGHPMGALLLAKTIGKIVPGKDYDKSSVKEVLEVKETVRQKAKDIEDNIDGMEGGNIVKVAPAEGKTGDLFQRFAYVKSGVDKDGMVDVLIQGETKTKKINLKRITTLDDKEVTKEIASELAEGNRVDVDSQDSVPDVFKDHDAPVKLEDPLEKFVVSAIQPGVSKKKLKKKVNDLATEVMDAKGENGYNDFIMRLRSIEELGEQSFGEINKHKKNLRRWWKQKAQYDLGKQSYWDGLKIVEFNTIDPSGTRIVEKRTPSLYEIVSHKVRRAMSFFTGHSKKLNRKMKYDVFDTNYDGTALLGRKDFAKITIAANKSGYYVISGVKDKQRALIHPYIVSGKKKVGSKIKRFFKDTKSFAPELESLYKKKKADFTDLLKRNKGKDENVSEIYDRIIASNITYLERINGGMKIDKILNPKNKGKFITNVMELNKRTQLIDAGELRWNPVIHRNASGDPNMRGIQIVLVNDLPVGYKEQVLQSVRGQNPIKAFGKHAKHHTDGIFILDQITFDSVVKDGGFPESSGVLKGIMRYATESEGLILGKYAYFRAGDGTHKEMVRHEIHGMLWDSAAKQTGLRNKVNMQISANADGSRRMSFYKPGKAIASAKKANLKAEDAYTVGFEGLTMNPTVFENPNKTMSDTRAVRQVFSQLKPEQILGEYEGKDLIEALSESLLTPVYEGTKESKQFVTDYKAAVKSGDKTKIAEMDLKLKDIKVDDIGVEDKVTLLYGKDLVPTKLYSKIWEHILKLDSRHEIDLDMELLSELDVTAKEEYIDTKRKSFSTVHRYLKMARASGAITPFIMNMKTIRPYAENVFRNYIVSSLVKPVMEHSGKAVGTPYDPMLQAKGDFKREEGNFYLYNSWKNKIIKWGETETTLESAFKDYQEVKERYDKMSPGDKRKDKGVIKNQIEAMEEDLTWAIIRVPSDSASGTRILKFGGFVDRRGAGILLNNKDMIALGGMDLDMDSVFLYQHLSKDPVLNKKLFKQIHNNKDEWVKGNKLLDVKAGSRKIELGVKQRSYGEGEHSKKILDLMDPFERWSVAQGAASGNKRVGSASNLSRRLSTFYSLLKQHGSGVVSRASTKFDFELNPDNGFLLRLFARDSINWSADAGDTAGLFSHPKLENVLIRKLFKPGTSPVFTYLRGRLKNTINMSDKYFAQKLRSHTIYGTLKRIDDALNGKDWKNNRSFSLRKTFSELRVAKSELESLGIKLPGVWYKAGDKLADLFESMDKSIFNFVDGKASFALNRMFDKVVASKAGKFVLASTFRKRIKTATFPDLKKMGNIKDVDAIRELWKDLVTQDKWDVLTAVMLTKTAREYEAQGGKLKDLENIVNVAEQYLSDYNRIMKVARYKRKKGDAEPRFIAMEPLYESMINYKRDLENPLEVEYFEKYIIGSLMKQDTDLAQAKDIARKNVDEAIDATTRADAELELLQIEKHWWQTNITRLGLSDSRVISDKALSDYITNYNNLGDMAKKGRTDAEIEASVKEALGIDVPDPKKATLIEETKQLNNAVEDSYVVSDFLNLLPELKKVKIQGKQVTPELRLELNNLKRELTWIFTKHPDLADKMFPSKFVGIAGKPDRALLKQIPSLPEAATLQDIRDFIGYFKLRHGRKFLTDLDPEKMKDMPVLRRHFAMWHSTVGQKLEKADMRFYPIEAALVRDKKGKVFNTLARLPVSTLGMQDVVANKIIMFKDAAERIVHTKIKDKFDYIDKIGVEGDELFEIATDLHQKRLYDGTREKQVFKTNAIIAERKLEKMKDKSYLIPVGEATKKMSAEEVVFKIQRDLRKFVKDFYKEYVNDRSGEADLKYLKWKDKENGELDFEATIKELADVMMQGKEPPRAPLNTMLRIAYERAMQIIVAPSVAPEYPEGATQKERNKIKDQWKKDVKDGKIKQVRVIDNPNETVRSKLLDYFKSRETGMAWDGGIGEVQEGYFPRGGHIKKEVEEHIDKRVRKAAADGATETELQRLLVKLRTEQAESLVEDGLFARGALEIALRSDVTMGDLETMGIFSKPGHALRRGEEPIPNWDKSRGALYRYSSQMISAYYNNLFALMSHRMIEKFEKESRLGEHTKDWKMFMQNYTMNVLGYPSVFPKEWLDRPSFPIKETPYYWMSDHLIHKSLNKVSDKYFGGKKFWKEGDATDMARKLAAFSNFDAKYQLMSLLSHTKTMVANMFGGTENTIASVGWRHWKDAGSLEHLKRVVPGAPKEAGWDWFQKFAEEAGAVESFFVNELRFAPQSKTARVKKFWKALGKKRRGEDKYAKMTIGEIGREFGVTDAVVNFAATAMRWSERKLRGRAFWAHYLKWADVFDMQAISRDAKHPWIMQLALRGVENTQFLYHNAARPAFARTNMGRVYSRFQTWAWNSIKFRKDLYKNAKAYGWKPGSEEMEQFRRIATGDLFIFALASAFPFSMFDSTLPPPMSYVMDFSELLFGDERTRDRAFYGTLPGPVAPLQAVMPPSARFILAPLGSMLKGDWDRFAAYHVWTMFPFGRVFRDLVKIYDNPVMAVERLTGFPIFKLQRSVKEWREKETLVPGGFLAPTLARGMTRRKKYGEFVEELDPWEIPPDYEAWERVYGSR